MDSCIYFSVGFKFYDIVRSTNTTDSWFECSDRGRNFIRKISLNRKTLEWIVQILREASKFRGNVVRRWEKKTLSLKLFVQGTLIA